MQLLQYLCFPHVLISQILKQLHDSATAGHLGVQKTLDKIRRRSTGCDSTRMWRIGVVSVRHVQQGNHQCLVVLHLCNHHIAMDIVGPFHGWINLVITS